ncbi:hypothetical protein G6O69_30970 [Pseudenhygromyxa sp. WMMC2535]|uniref:hypothetical protein n=1 Tax=Pseudenhygromyxa sp. WMMC2535 TaxID=2712867 RepID=UPI0015547B7D|nr:hypothetical protein [Pseudenhygromyxa sp. WMMC2535]NVB42287.1 hypothetical protein [Pseudenhygromyxa sp. WMMC2535]
MGRGNRSAAKRRREADRARQKQDKAERKRQRKATSTGGIEIASVEDIQTVAVNTEVSEIRADGTVLSGDEDLQAASNGEPCRLFVGGLSWETNSQELREAFADVGDVIEATVVLDRDTGRSRGFGFVTMGSRKQAMEAMRGLNGTELDGRSIRIDMATER